MKTIICLLFFIVLYAEEKKDEETFKYPLEYNFVKEDMNRNLKATIKNYGNIPQILKFNIDTVQVHQIINVYLLQSINNLKKLEYLELKK